MIDFIVQKNIIHLLYSKDDIIAYEKWNNDKKSRRIWKTCYYDNKYISISILLDLDRRVKLRKKREKKKMVKKESI